MAINLEKKYIYATVAFALIVFLYSMLVDQPNEIGKGMNITATPSELSGGFSEGFSIGFNEKQNYLNVLQMLNKDISKLL